MAVMMIRLGVFMYFSFVVPFNISLLFKEVALLSPFDYLFLFNQNFFSFCCSHFLFNLQFRFTSCFTWSIGNGILLGKKIVF